MIKFLKAVCIALVAALVLTAACGCTPKAQKTESEVATASEPEIKDEITSEQSANGYLVFTYPTSDSVQVYENKISFNGVCSTKFPLEVNKNRIEYSAEGYFAAEIKLNKGENTVTFKNGNETKTFTVNYTTPLIKSFTPDISDLKLDYNSEFSVNVCAKTGSTVMAEFMGKRIKLKAETASGNYCTYSGIIYTSATDESTPYTGTVKFNAVKGNETESRSSPKITVSQYSLDTISGADSTQNPSPLLELSNSYKNVGKTYIAEVIASSAETFSGNTVDDYSRPTNCYLPKGTVDYCSPSKIYDSASHKKYYILRNNVRVYAKKSYIKVYKGTLPSKNTVTFKKSQTSGKYYTLSFGVKWKAPFKFQLKKQSFKNPNVQDYNISKVTYSYIDITFCYASKIKGSFKLGSNLLFKKAKWIKNKSDYTLRLYLKKTGAFYGWRSYYNSNGELVFAFLNPAQIKKTNTNKYGYSLKGITVVVDAGHGGTDGGTYSVSASSKYVEKYFTLLYAKELGKQLKKLGATVYMTRTSDTTMSLRQRFNYISKAKANLAVSIHFNGSTASSAKGYFMGHYNEYTYNPARYLSLYSGKTGIFKKYSGGIDWHYFNLSRVSACPVVLTENGFLTNASDYKKIKNSTYRKNYIEGMVKGIVKYFVSIKPKQTVVVTASHNTASKVTSSKVTSSKVTSSKVTSSKITSSVATGSKLTSSNSAKTGSFNSSTDIQSIFSYTSSVNAGAYTTP